MILVNKYNEYIATLLAESDTENNQEFELVFELVSITDEFEVLPPEERQTIALNLQHANSVKAIFKTRAELLIENATNYTSILTADLAKNKPWVTLARTLCEEGLFPFHHYHLLFPEALNIDEKDYVQYIPYYEQPLSELFYSAQEKRLLSLQSGIESAKANYGKMFFYLNAQDVEQTDKVARYELNYHELNLLERINPGYFHQLQTIQNDIKNNELDKPLSFITLTILGLVIESSYFMGGDHGLYDEAQLAQANEAFYLFYTMLHDSACAEERIISLDEKQKLMGQIIRYKDRNIVFEQLWHEALSDAVCLAWADKDWASLIINYLPNYQFTHLSFDDKTPQIQTKEYCNSSSPFQTEYQTLALAFIVMDVLNYRVVNCARLKTFVNDKLYPLAQHIRNEKSNHTRCVEIAKEAICLFNDNLISLDQLRPNHESYKLNKKLELLREISKLTPVNAQNFIEKKLSLLPSMPLPTKTKLLNHLPETREYSNEEKIAYGFLITQSMKDASESNTSIIQTNIELFKLLNQDEVLSIETHIDTLMEEYSEKAYTKGKIQPLLAQILTFPKEKTISFIIHVGVELVVMSLCHDNSHSPSFFKSELKDTTGKLINVVQLKTDFIRLYVADPEIIPYNLLDKILTYILSIGTHSFKANLIESTTALVQNACTLNAIELSTSYS